MLLASAPLREWSLLSSRPTSRAHDRSLRQGDPTRRTKLTDHLPRIHYHCLNPVACSSSIHPPTHSLSIHRLTKDQSMSWNTRWQSLGSPEHDAGRQSRAATAQCQAFAREDVQRNWRRTRRCMLVWPTRFHYQPRTLNTHLMAQKTWPTANHRIARAQWIHEWSTSAQPTGRQRLDEPATYLVAEINQQTPDDRPISCTRTWLANQ